MIRIFSTVLAALLIVLPSCRKGTEVPVRKPSPSPAVTGGKAPGFTLKDTTGRAVNLSDFSGKIVVIDFWATWCGPCGSAVKELELLHRKYQGKDVVVLGISMDLGDNAAEKVTNFVRGHGVTYPMLIDDRETSRLYGVTSVPATYLLDRRQVIVKIYPGYIPGLGKRITGQIDALP